MSKILRRDELKLSARQESGWRSQQVTEVMRNEGGCGMKNRISTSCCSWCRHGEQYGMRRDGDAGGDAVARARGV